MTLPRQSLLTMLELQHRMNTRVHPEWAHQGFAWYRAAWIECGELIDHFGYKWWKKQTPDMNQVQLEVVDIWHFGMSAILSAEFSRGGDVASTADAIEEALAVRAPATLDVRDATEALALHCLESKRFCPLRFWDLMISCDLDEVALFRMYVGKNVLNFFRQDHGYQDGSYQKLWQGREDNEHLVELAASLDSEAVDYADALYASLKQRYAELSA